MAVVVMLGCLVRRFFLFCAFVGGSTLEVIFLGAVFFVGSHRLVVSQDMFLWIGALMVLRWVGLTVSMVCGRLVFVVFRRCRSWRVVSKILHTPPRRGGAGRKDFCIPRRNYTWRVQPSRMM